MPFETQPAPPPWPTLTDEAVVELHHWLTDFLILFESHYFGQINRHRHDRSQHNLTQPDCVQPDLFQFADPDTPPF